MNEAPLLQSGRSRLDFLIAASRGLARLHGTVRRQVDALDIAVDTLPEDLDERDALLSGRLAGSDAFHTADALLGFLGMATVARRAMRSRNWHRGCCPSWRRWSNVARPP